MNFIDIGVILSLWLLGTSVLALILCYLKPNREHVKFEVYHSVTQQLGDDIYSETKIMRSSSANNIFGRNYMHPAENYQQKLNNLGIPESKYAAYTAAGKNFHENGLYEQTNKLELYNFPHAVKTTKQLDEIA